MDDELFKKIAALDPNDSGDRAELEPLAEETWERMPIAIRDEIEMLTAAGWRRTAPGVLTDPGDEEIWVYIHHRTYEKTLSIKRARRIAEAAGAGGTRTE